MHAKICCPNSVLPKRAKHVAQMSYRCCPNICHPSVLSPKHLVTRSFNNHINENRQKPQPFPSAVSNLLVTTHCKEYGSSTTRRLADWKLHRKCWLFMPASLIPYSIQKMGSNNIKPCLRYDITSIWFY